MCRACQADGQTHIEPQLRSCKECVQVGIKCCRLLVIAVIHDCEQKNKTALETFLALKDQGKVNPKFLATSVGPDAIHIGKCLIGSLSNWWLTVDSYRISLVVLRILRNNRNSELGRLNILGEKTDNPQKL